MRRPRCSESDKFGNILTDKRLETFVHAVRPGFVSVETNRRKLCIHETRANLTNTNGGFHALIQESFGDGVDSMLCSLNGDGVILAGRLAISDANLPQYIDPPG